MSVLSNRSFIILLFLLLLYPVITAQVPYEYFEIQSIEPPYASKHAVPLAPDMPDKLGIDSNTGVAGDLKLSDPFAPPVRTYKRRLVFSQIRLGQDDFSVDPSTAPCHPVNVQTAPVTHSLHRSALVFLNLSANQIADIPTDSPEMVITSIRARRTDSHEQENTPVALYQCPDDRYGIRVPDNGVYQIEYETAALPDSAVPFSADFFMDAVPNHPNPSLQDVWAQFLADQPELMRISKSGHALTELIRFFQNFESQSLDISNENSSVSWNIARGIIVQKRGLCRHRAILFMLTASAMGYPVRIVANEAHAFIEIYHRNRWYPVELGGDAQSLTIQSTSRQSTVQQNYSFLDSERETSQNSGTAVPQSRLLTQDNDESGQSYILDDNAVNRVKDLPPGMDAVNRGNIQPVNNAIAEFRFVPLIQIPAHAARHEMLNISGQMVDEYAHPVPNTSFTLVMKNGSRRITVHAQTDIRGYISTTIRIPPQWPLGETTLEWTKK